MAKSRLMPPSLRPPADAVRWTALAFVYWLVFMGVLTPGNLAAALASGGRWDWGREALRLVCAGLLGASVTPILLSLARRYPANSALNLARQGLAVLVMAPTLILISCVLAAWFLEGKAWPSVAEARQQLLANSLLLIFCLSLFLALIQVAQRLRPPAEGAWLRRLTIRERGRVTLLDLNEVDWIETQGNYQALHAREGVHLLRETSERLAAQLDPARFVRIHRRSIVAVDRVRQVEPLANGDATVRLADGTELRLSRRHRESLKARLGA
ncbi:LytTR family DNA-binding domain-containing protein [Phenylobacterium sp.]|uniref:LytR/AlgR family response regulator transcription factor n=1 Tax=Phenylobacterium sp. TaxID=1871053 RepID=UPI0030F3E155